VEFPVPEQKKAEKNKTKNKSARKQATKNALQFFAGLIVSFFETENPKCFHSFDGKFIKTLK
jgi:hypothetical protein